MVQPVGFGDGSADPGLDLRMLGPLEAWRDGIALRLGGARQRAVLASLLCESSGQASTDAIVDAIWGESPPGGVLTTLQTYVFHLRQVLEPARAKGEAPSVIVTVPGGYRLAVPRDCVDAVRFQDLVTGARQSLEGGPRSDPERAAALLQHGLDLWRGPVLADLASVLPPAAAVAGRLEEQRLSATELLAEAQLRLGRPEEALATVDPVVAAFPMREHATALRMLSLYRGGRQSEALAAYRRLHSTLDEELAIRPSAEVEELHRRMLRQDPALAGPQQAAPAVVAPTPVPAPSSGPERMSTGPDAPEPGLAGDGTPATSATTAGAPAHAGAQSDRKGRVRRRRWVAITGVVALAAAALVGSTAVLARRNAVSPLAANTAGPLTSEGNAVRGDAVALPSAPISMVGAGGAVWAVLDNDNAVVKIDPATRQVVQTVRDVGGDPQSVAASGDDLWVAGFDQKVVTRINAATGVTVAKIPVGVEPAAVTTEPGGAVWVANSGDNTVQRIDPMTEQVGTPIPVGPGPDALAVDGNTLWVANGRGETLTQVDIRTGQRAASDVHVDSGPAALAVTVTDVWVANEFGQSVSRVNKSTGRVTRIDVDDGPSSLGIEGDRARPDAVWVTSRYAGTLTRIDASTNQASTARVDSAPTSLTTTQDGQVWAAGGAYTSPDHRGGTLTWTGTPFAQGMDPAGAGTYGADHGALGRLVFDSLVAFRYAGGRASRALVPDLATTIPEPTDGGRTYIFTLRPDIHYSTGALVRASDFLRGFQRALQPSASYPSQLDAVIGAKECTASKRTGCDLSKGVIPDDANGRLTLHLTKPDPELLFKLPYFVFPTPAGSDLAVPAKKPIPGTGPYVVASDRGYGVTLERNPRFRSWSFAAQPDGFPDTIVFDPLPTDTQVIAAVLGGKTLGGWVLGPLPPTATSQPAYIHEYDAQDLQYLYLNTTLAPFDDVRVRRAVSYALDRRVIARQFAASPECQTIPAGFPGFRPYCPYQSGPADGPYQGPDLAKAHELVRESGTAGMHVGVRYNPNFPMYVAQARYAGSVLTTLGYDVTVQPIPPEHLRGLGPDDPGYRTYQLIAQLGWIADYASPSTFYTYASSCAQRNFSGYCNRAIQAVADTALSLTRTDPTASLAAWAEVDHMLVDDAAVITTISRRSDLVVSPTVGNVLVQPGGRPLLGQMWVR